MDVYKQLEKMKKDIEDKQKRLIELPYSKETKLIDIKEMAYFKKDIELTVKTYEIICRMKNVAPQGVIAELKITVSHSLRTMKKIAKLSMAKNTFTDIQGLLNEK